MSKAKRGLSASDGGAAVAMMEAPEPVTASQPSAYIVNFRTVDSGGNPRAHAWLPWTLVIEGCASADDARTKLHAILDEAIFLVKPASH